MTGYTRRFIFLLFLCGIGGIVSSAWARTAFRGPQNVPYKTFIFSIQDDDLRRIVMDSSNLVKGESAPPETVEILKNRAQEDLANLQQVLSAYGYYDVSLDYFVDTRTTPTVVYLKIDLGPLYTIGAFKIKSDPPNTNLVAVLGSDIEKVGISLGQPARRELVQQATLNTINYLQKHGYPFAKLKADRVVIDRSKKEMQVALLVVPGGMARFGNTILQENGGVTGEFIKSRLKWKRGDIYSEQKVLDTIQSLYNTRLFKEVKITHDDRVDQGGFINLYLKLVAAEQNIVRPIASYTPGISLEAGVSWEKRNIGSSGDILSTALRFGKNRKVLHGRYIIPDLEVLNLNLSNDVHIHKESLKPYSITGINMQSVADYPIIDDMLVEAGVGLDFDNLTVRSHRADFRYLKALVGAQYSTVTDVTAPKKGISIRLDLIPYVRIFNRLDSFMQIKVRPEAYIPLSPDEKLVGHGWAQIGFSPGAGSRVIPAHRLYYNEGGSTVRGYRFQMAGTLDNDIPTGGRSALSFGAEVEYYFTDVFSILTFLDLGTTYDRPFPDFKNSLLYGIGGGARYRTPWGILRLDVASPIRRRTQDSALEIYAGLDKPL